MLTLGGSSFFLGANPLMKTSGYHVLVTLLDMPDLRQRAHRALFGKLKGAPVKDDEEGSFALRMYALASLIFLVALVGFMLWLIATWLEVNYSGAGVSVFLGDC